MGVIAESFGLRTQGIEKPCIKKLCIPHIFGLRETKLPSGNTHGKISKDTLSAA